MPRYIRPQLLKKNYLETVKNRLKSNREGNLDLSFNSINNFLKNNIVPIVLLIIFIFVCWWRYNMKSNGELEDPKVNIENIRDENESILSALNKIKKKNRILNERKYAPGNSEQKQTQIKNLNLRRGDNIPIRLPKRNLENKAFNDDQKPFIKKEQVGREIQTPLTLNEQPINIESSLLLASNYDDNYGAAF